MEKLRRLSTALYEAMVWAGAGGPDPEGGDGLDPWVFRTCPERRAGTWRFQQEAVAVRCGQPDAVPCRCAGAPGPARRAPRRRERSDRSVVPAAPDRIAAGPVLAGTLSRPIAAFGLGRRPGAEGAGAHACETGAGVGLAGGAPRENAERAHATSIGNRSPNRIANSARAWDQKPWGRCHFRSIFRSVR